MATVLSTIQERQFLKWYARWSQKLNLPAVPSTDYDWRNAYRHNAKPNRYGVWPRAYKTTPVPDQTMTFAYSQLVTLEMTRQREFEMSGGGNLGIYVRPVDLLAFGQEATWSIEGITQTVGRENLFSVTGASGCSKDLTLTYPGGSVTKSLTLNYGMNQALFPPLTDYFIGIAFGAPETTAKLIHLNMTVNGHTLVNGCGGMGHTWFLLKFTNSSGVTLWARLPDSSTCQSFVPDLNYRTLYNMVLGVGMEYVSPYYLYSGGFFLADCDIALPLTLQLFDADTSKTHETTLIFSDMTFESQDLYMPNGTLASACQVAAVDVTFSTLVKPDSWY